MDAHDWIRRPRAVALALTLSTVALAACGGDSDSTADSSPTSTTAETAATTTVAAATTVAATTTPPATTAPPTCDSYTPNEELPLELCDSGEAVQKVQQGLVDSGYDIVVDGLFGPQTQTALLEYQADEGTLPVDGVVGPETYESLVPA